MVNVTGLLDQAREAPEEWSHIATPSRWVKISPEARDALVELADAAARLVVLEFDPGRNDEQNAEIARRAREFRAALKRLRR